MVHSRPFYTKTLKEGNKSRQAEEVRTWTRDTIDVAKVALLLVVRDSDQVFFRVLQSSSLLGTSSVFVLDALVQHVPSTFSRVNMPLSVTGKCIMPRYHCVL